jgi:hypothetical protein
MSFPPLPEVSEAVRGESFVLVHVNHADQPELADRSTLKDVHMDPERGVSPLGDGQRQ